MPLELGEPLGPMIDRCYYHQVVQTRGVVELHEPVGLVDCGDLGVVGGLPGTPCVLGKACPPDAHHSGYGRKRGQGTGALVQVSNGPEGHRDLRSPE